MAETVIAGMIIREGASTLQAEMMAEGVEQSRRDRGPLWRQEGIRLVTEVGDISPDRDLSQERLMENMLIMPEELAKIGELIP